MKKEVYDDMNQSPIGPDEGPMRVTAGKMGLTTAPSDTYSNSCIGELSEDANPHVMERATEEIQVRACPGHPTEITKGYVSKAKAGLRPTYKPYPKEH